MSTILVTGGAGFIGHKLVERLLANTSDNVCVVDNLSFGSRAFVPRDPRVEFLDCDLRARRDLLSLLAERRFVSVYHLGAIHYIPYCNAHPEETFETNVIGTRNLFEGLRKQRELRCVSNTSTMAVYPISESAQRESDEIGPIDIYGKTKALTEDLARLFERDTGVPTVSWRLTNAIGSNETNEHLFPVVMKQFLAGAKTISLGNLEPRRNYIDTRDVCAYMQSFVQNPRPGYSVLNLGSEHELDVRQVVALFADVTGHDVSVVQDPARVRPVERQRLQPAIDELVRVCGFRAQYSPRESVAAMLEAARTA